MADHGHQRVCRKAAHQDGRLRSEAFWICKQAVEVGLGGEDSRRRVDYRRGRRRWACHVGMLYAVRPLWLKRVPQTQRDRLKKNFGDGREAGGLGEGR